jgi:hypothetical protein
MVKNPYPKIMVEILVMASMMKACTWYMTLLPCWAIINTRGTAKPFSIKQSFSLWEDFLVFLTLNKRKY